MEDALSMEEVLEYISRNAGPEQAKCSHAMFNYLYKEILVNRILILETDPQANRGAIEHTERLVNDLNSKLMAQVTKDKAPA